MPNVSIGGSRALDTTIDIDRIRPVMRPVRAEDLTEEDTTAAIQTTLKSATTCHVPHGDPKNRYAISAGTYSNSEHVREYSDYKTYHLPDAT